MNKTFFKIGLGLLVLAGLAWPSRGAVTSMKTLHGHVPSVVSHLAPLNRVNATNVLHLAIGLPLRNQEQMDSLLQQISDPSSPNYRHYLTTEEFTAQFGPSEADSQAIIYFAESNGLTVKRVHSNRMLVEVDGKAADVERAFNVTLRNYHLAAENRDFYAPDQEPSVPSDLPVLDVQGLNSYVQPKPRLHIGPVKSFTTKLGSGPFGTYLGNDFRPAYVPGTTLTGTGQNVALFEYDGYLASDIIQYEQSSGITTSVVLTNILLQGFSGNPTPFGGQSEVTLDIDMIIAMAPGVNQIQVYEGNIEVAYLPNLVLNSIATDNAARQISCSWGWTGGPSATTDQIFKQMILQGQTFYDASGDVCAFLPPGQPGSVDDPSLPNAPSDDPYITQVGATTLQTTGPGGSFVSESVWNWGIEISTNFDGVGSSGGISGFYPIPIWQQGINMTTNMGSTTMRNLPDVAMTGDNIDIIVDGADQPGIGGTSCAAPLWAGFTALVNQQGAASGRAAIGFINPAIYALAKTNSTFFHDVVIGNNTWSQSTNEFFAVPGFDLCDGWGSPNGTNLINALVLLAPTNPAAVIAPIFPAPKQPWGNTLSVMNGYNPNGLWMLFLQDDTLNNYAGTNYNGWSLNLTTANPVGFAADNQLYINANNVSVAPGAQWTTTLAVTNYGPSASTNVFVTDTLPSPGVTLLSSSSTMPGSTVATVGGTLIWNVGNLPVGTGGTLSLNFQANSAGVYTNGATVAATTPDPNPDDNSVGVNIAVGVSTPPVLAPYLVPGGGGALKLSVNNDAGSTVVIQASTNLITWLPIYTNVAPFTFTTFDTTNYSQRFYRAVVGQ